MSLIRWEPLRDSEEFFNRLLPSIVRRWPSTASGDNGSTGVEWAPSADISENESEYLIRAELPAVKKEDVKISVSGGALLIEGERRYANEEKTEKFHRRESFQGKFSRNFLLPDNADDKNIRAESKDGVLIVHVPKVKAEKPKTLQIKVE